jgi:hypothetical protein
MIWTKANEVMHSSAAIGRHSTVGSHGGADMRLIPSMLNASDAERAAFPAQLRSRLMLPPDTPSEEADLAFEKIADKIIAYLSSPVPSAQTRHTGRVHGADGRQRGIRAVDVRPASSLSEL